ncbi:hypothetical protein K445DRAFT_290637 [Daldinia sp. EC12]|nr:hypothetical protein K445DRAFT_290637 [Daldinia sp. EC12]
MKGRNSYNLFFFFSAWRITLFVPFNAHVCALFTPYNFGLNRRRFRTREKDIPPNVRESSHCCTYLVCFSWAWDYVSREFLSRLAGVSHLLHVVGLA